MKFIFPCLIIAIILYSCDEDSTNQKSVFVTDITKVHDTVILVKDSTMAAIFAESLPSGAYQGTFPCKGCGGIQQTIIFNDNKTYKEEQMFWSKNAITKTTEGNWQRIEGKIELTQNNKTAMVLIKKQDTLFAVNINGVTVNNTSKYILIKRILAADNPAWDKKRKEGIDFAGIGNEPFWNLEIDNEKFILFKLADWKKPIIVTAEKPLVNEDSTFYKLRTDTTKWTITIFPQFCSDGMSDYLYQNKVNVNYKGILYKGCGVILSKKIGQKNLAKNFRKAVKN